MIFGESAAAGKLRCSGDARGDGLFHRAIIQSGTWHCGQRPHLEAAPAAATLLAALRVSTAQEALGIALPAETISPRRQRSV